MGEAHTCHANLARSFCLGHPVYEPMPAPQRLPAHSVQLVGVRCWRLLLHTVKLQQQGRSLCWQTTAYTVLMQNAVLAQTAAHRQQQNFATSAPSGMYVMPQS